MGASLKQFLSPLKMSPYSSVGTILEDFYLAAIVRLWKSTPITPQRILSASHMRYNFLVRNYFPLRSFELVGGIFLKVSFAFTATQKVLVISLGQISGAVQLTSVKPSQVFSLILVNINSLCMNMTKRQPEFCFNIEPSKYCMPTPPTHSGIHLSFIINITTGVLSLQISQGRCL